MSKDDAPVVAVLHDPADGPPPALDKIEPFASSVLAVSDLDGLRRALQTADVLMVTDFRTALLREAWPATPSIRWIHATSAGVDALLFPALVESDLPLTNARGIFDRSIAEYVLGAILIFVKDFHGSLAYQRRHQWHHRDTERLAGRRALVVGAGSIGREIARLLSANGIEVEGIARRAREADADFIAVHAVDDLHKRLPAADFVILAAPLTEATSGLFDRATFERMAPHARLINVGRGPLVQTPALVDVLRERRIAGAALDVFEQEPLPLGHPLWDMPNVIITAHMAGDFIGWREALVDQFVDNLKRWREGRPLNNLVDKQRGYAAPMADARIPQPSNKHEEGHG